MAKKVLDKAKGKFVWAAGGAAGATSVLGSWQVCHNLCLGVVALLSIVGITVVGMPLMFLQKVALPFWIIAASLLVATLFIYARMKCVSHKLIMLNSGFVIIGTPFQSLQKFSQMFWVVGGALVLFSIVLFAKDKIKRRKHERIK